MTALSSKEERKLMNLLNSKKEVIDVHMGQGHIGISFRDGSHVNFTPTDDDNISVEYSSWYTKGEYNG